VDARDANAAAKHNLLAPQARAAALARLALFPLLCRRGLALELPALELRVLEGEILFARLYLARERRARPDVHLLAAERGLIAVARPAVPVHAFIHLCLAGQRQSGQRRGPQPPSWC